MIMDRLELKETKILFSGETIWSKPIITKYYKIKDDWYEVRIEKIEDFEYREVLEKISKDSILFTELNTIK